MTIARNINGFRAFQLCGNAVVACGCKFRLTFKTYYVLIYGNDIGSYSAG
jgi:hypothetical protein